MLYFVGVYFEKKSGNIKNCLTSGFGILQKILSIRVFLLLDILVGRRIWRCNKLNARSSRKVLTYSNVSKFNRSMLNSPRRTIALLASLDRLSNNGLR